MIEPQLSHRNGSGQPEAADGTLAAGGIMGEYMRAFDWSQTALGPVETWPQSLRTTASTCLNSRFAIVVWWGKELVTLYNDGYMAILGKKHPQALGSRAVELWPEIWHIIGPMLKGVLERGEATWADNLLLELERNGYPEECYFTFSYSPIRDESGGVGGVFTPVQETTSQVIGERRLRTLRDLADGARAANAQSGEEVCRLAGLTLANNLFDIPFAAFYLFSADRSEARLAAASGVPTGCALIPDRVEARSDSAWPFINVALSGRTEVVGLPGDLPDVPCGAWPVPPREVMVLPLSPGGQRAGFALLAVNPRKRLDEEYQGFLSLIGGHVTTAIAEARALEEERRRAQALAELDRAKTAFFSNVSHEFRTPLTLMLGPLEEILAAQDALPAGITELAAVTHRNGLRLQKLVNTLLDFSRIEAGRVQASCEPTDLSAFTAELASTFRSAMEKAGLRLIVDCQALPEPVYVDRDMWEKVVLNLLSNAFKYTLAGHVAVTLSTRSGCAVLSVADTGTGIAQHELPHIFERFHRIEGAQGRTQEGTGIGLALVAELIKLHSGTVEAQSSLGEGSTFTVALPFGTAHLPRHYIDKQTATPTDTPTAAPAQVPEMSSLHHQAYIEEASRWLPRDQALAAAATSATAEGIQTSSPVAHKAAGGRILIADDNADMREYLARLLGERYEVEMVADGQAALLSVRENPPDLVLSDVMMPRLDGFGLLSALRANVQTRTLPVILLSARAGEEARVEGMDAGASDYLVKPFTARELAARVGAQIEMARLRQQASAREAELRAEAEAERDKAVGILESITDAFATFDADWRFIYVNREAERLIGLRREELLGQSHWDVFASTLGTIVEREYRRAVRDQTPVAFEYFHEPGNRWFDIRGYPTGEGGLSNYFRDITEQKRAEEILREQDALREADRRKWRELFFKVPAAVGLLRGPDHIVELGNHHFERLTGRPASQFLDKPVREAFPEIVPQGFLQMLDGVYRTGEPYIATEAAVQIDRQGDGVLQPRYLNFVYLPTRDDAGRVDGIFVHAVDVTALVAARKRIEEINQRFTLALAATRGLVYDWEPQSGRVTHGLENVTGWKEAEVKNKPEWWSDLIHPGDFERMRRAGEDYPAEGSMRILTYRIRHRGGDWKWVEDHAIVHRNEHGEIARFIGITFDITARKRAAEALQMSESRLRFTLNAASFGSWEMNLQTLRVERSARHDAIFGYEVPAPDCTYAQLLEHIVPEDRENADRDFRSSLRDDGEWNVECRIMRASDQAVRWIWIYGKTISEAAGRPSLMLGLVADITERKEAESALAKANEELRRANDGLEQFGYSASHDLREPLRSVTIYSELLETRYGEKLDGEALEMLNHLRGGAIRMEFLVRDLLEYTQVKKLEDDGTTDAMQVMADTLANLESAIAESGAQVSCGELPAVQMPRVHLQQLFQNLIGNALKYRSEKTPVVRVAAARAERHWLFSVSDNGIGIEAQYAERIFGLFKRLHPGNEYSGTGIGLAICQRIVDRYGGRIWVESEPGQGSTFYFTVPQ